MKHITNLFLRKGGSDRLQHTEIRSIHACRQCLNQKYELNLEREDCLYYLYPGECSRCREMRNIVVDVR